MKFLKKINKGLILTLITIIILSIYLISVEVTRSKEKTEIEEACKSYIELINKYAVMQDENQKLYNSNEMTYEDKEKKSKEVENAIKINMDKLSQELKSKMIDNDKLIKMQKDRVEENVKNNNDIFSSVMTKCSKEIKKINKMAFDNDQVTVTFESKVDVDIKYFGETEEKNELLKKNDFDTKNETITLQKVNDSWKVVYADLQYYNYSSDIPGTMTMTMSF